MPNVNTATAADFDRVAKRDAKACSFWLLAMGVVWWVGSPWWAITPGILALYYGVGSISCKRQAQHLRDGTYRFSNPNNGVLGGDATNLGSSEVTKTKGQRAADLGRALRSVYDQTLREDLDDSNSWERAIQQYGKLMANSSGAILPESLLPLPKDEMKRALKCAWTSNNDKKIRSILAVAYAHLGHFRNDIDEPIDISSIHDLTLTALEAANHIDEREADLELWQEVNRECIRLAVEFDTFVASSLPDTDDA